MQEKKREKGHHIVYASLTIANVSQLVPWMIYQATLFTHLTHPPPLTTTSTISSLVGKINGPWKNDFSI